MAVTAQQIVTLARNDLSDSATQGRFSDAAMLLWTQVVVNRMTRRILFPESRIQFSTSAYQQEYPLPEILRTLRVYLAGQLLTPTTVQVLEGHQIQMYDQSGNQGAPTQQGGGPAGNAGTASPQWTLATPANYPVLTALGWPRPDAVPWFVGSPPRYYFRGGVIGFVPMPAGTVTVTIDCVLEPQPIPSLASNLLIPDSWVECAASGVVAKAMGSDRDAFTDHARETSMANFEQEIKNLIATKRRYDGDAPRGPKVLTGRSFYSHAARRYNSGSGWDD